MAERRREGGPDRGAPRDWS
uniref:Uncharacterized protein n=1 Tax=Arundo donax TaxID=35708 RepID=A0A0A9C1T0_ARUDO